jgi:protein-tyrosine phosphatase
MNMIPRDPTAFKKIDVHSHLIPGVDDGCRSLEESLACARMLVAAGYSHTFCTPHVWPSLPDNTIATVVSRRTDALQQALDDASIPLTLLPGGEINLRPDTTDTAPHDLITYALRHKHVLIDLWAEKLPPFFDPAVRWLQSLGLTVILAHPERMRAVQDNPALADHFAELGILLQGNLECLSHAPSTLTFRTAYQFLTENRYFMLGTDLHNLPSLPPRLEGLHRAEMLVGPETLQRLTQENPRQLLPRPPASPE